MLGQISFKSRINRIIALKNQFRAFFHIPFFDFRLQCFQEFGTTQLSGSFWFEFTFHNTGFVLLVVNSHHRESHNANIVFFINVQKKMAYNLFYI